MIIAGGECINFCWIGIDKAEGQVYFGVGRYF